MVYEFGIFGQEFPRLLAGGLEEGQVAGQLGQADGREAGLGGAQKIAGAADFEVRLGDGEAVAGLFEDFQAVEFFFGVFAGEQDAPGFFAAAADTPAFDYPEIPGALDSGGTPY